MPDMVYPPSCKEVDENLSKEELIKRLKLLARAFQDMSQEDDNDPYRPLALHIASEFFLEHNCKDVRLLAACCIADVFRVYAPHAPYTEGDQQKDIFMFLVQQLRGLENTEAPSFKRYFYLLENLAWVKSFNICLELPDPDSQEVFCALYRLIFNIVNEHHQAKVKNFMLDIMCPLIMEGDTVSQPLLDIILLNLIEPNKSRKKEGYNLAKELIRRTSTALEPYIQGFFNTALMLGKTSQSEVSDHLNDLIFELNIISPSVLVSVLPQLEFKLKSTDADERKGVVRLLGKMFAGKEYDLAERNRVLWNCYVGRFNDVDTGVRMLCVQSAEAFISYHPNLRKDIIGCLVQRERDVSEGVRFAVVKGIITAAKKDIREVPMELITCVKKRTLDKMFKVRKEALLGLAQVYKNCYNPQDAYDDDTREKISWIKEKLLHQYYQPSLEDKIQVERIFNNSLVPFNLPAEERMTRLLELYQSVDDRAVKVINEIFKTQHILKTYVKQLLDLHNKKPEDFEKRCLKVILSIAKLFHEPNKMLDSIKRFNKLISEQSAVLNYLGKFFDPDITCRKAEEIVKQLILKVGNTDTPYFIHIKSLLERIAPVLIDKQSLSLLVSQARTAALDDNTEDDDNRVEVDVKQQEMSLKLLLTLSLRYPSYFPQKGVVEDLIEFASSSEVSISILALQILKNIGGDLQDQFPDVLSKLLPILERLAKSGTPKQAKHAVLCIPVLFEDKTNIFSTIIQDLDFMSMDLDSENYITALSTLGSITFECRGDFLPEFRTYIKDHAVKKLIMLDREPTQNKVPNEKKWVEEESMSKITTAKIYGMKLITKFLQSNEDLKIGSSVFRMFYRIISQNGDLLVRGLIPEAEMARLRLCAASCMLKLAQIPHYFKLMDVDCFCELSYIISDPIYQVRNLFSTKLHKLLLSLRLPLQFLSYLTRMASDPESDLKDKGKIIYRENIVRRREWIKTNQSARARQSSYLPEYVLPYAIYLLAHDEEFESIKDVKALKKLKNNLWFIMEPLMTKNEFFSFGFLYKMFETIKVSRDIKDKDGTDTTDTSYNSKLYCICDLAIYLLGTHTKTDKGDHPGHIVPPKQFFVEADKKFTNTRNYLPKDFLVKKSTTSLLSDSSDVATPMEATENKPAAKRKTKKTETQKPTQVKKNKRNNSAIKENVTVASRSKQKPSQSKKPDTSDQEDDQNTPISSPNASVDANKTSSVQKSTLGKKLKQTKLTQKSKKNSGKSPSSKSPVKNSNKASVKNTVKTSVKTTVRSQAKDAAKPQGKGKTKSAVKMPVKVPTKSPLKRRADSKTESPVIKKQRTDNSASATPVSSPIKVSTRKRMSPARYTPDRDEPAAKSPRSSPVKVASSPQLNIKRKTGSNKKRTDRESSTSEKSPSSISRKTQNIRLATSLVNGRVNGTSDGESNGTPSPRKRAAAVKKAIESMGENDSSSAPSIRRGRSKKK